jgi:hypothetical protein
VSNVSDDISKLACNKLLKIKEVATLYDAQQWLDAIDGIDYDRLREICTAEREGRVVVLPCKVGDTIYRNNIGDEIEPIVSWEIAEVRIFADEILIIDDSENEATPCDFGKTVFLTHAQAEAALAKGGE